MPRDLTEEEKTALIEMLGGEDAALGVLKGELSINVQEAKEAKLFSTPREQVQTLLQINENVWKDRSITEKAIKAIGDPPKMPVSDAKHLWCVALIAQTEDAVQTLKRNWAACRYVLGDEAKQEGGICLGPNNIRLRPESFVRCVRSGVRPRLRWAIIELGRKYKGERVDVSRTCLDVMRLVGVGDELPLIGALHPNWTRSMNGADIPFVSAPDLQVALGETGQFYYALSFERNPETTQVNLSVVYVGSPNLRMGCAHLCA